MKTFLHSSRRDQLFVLEPFPVHAFDGKNISIVKFFCKEKPNAGGVMLVRKNNHLRKIQKQKIKK